ncbi:15-methylpalmitoyl-4-hydroxy-2-pyrone synthase [Seinonella peptonophila]|uniref:15-methylpalmitoyl-4-hydroxy-2-pyrone synthase n=2 Tax=Seinonella peptonophila TaxID=112248 RepID=A0A1M4WLB0_9BACL|nr:15-methylpalmitoyl-4-hydroxy-2-pyrone synthase [Seinonella peptonophila]
MPRILSVGTAVPPYLVKQLEAKKFAHRFFSDSIEQLDRLLTIFEHTGIDTRHLSRPIAWFQEKHTWKEKNDAYIKAACQLGEEAILRCLKPLGMMPNQIDHMIFVSTTGLSTPSIDAHLANRLQMNPKLKRTPIWGLGCAGGVVGLARAAEWSKAFPKANVLLVTVECCSLTFRHEDQSKSNLVATSLFADGAAAVLIRGKKESSHEGNTTAEIVGSMSHLLPDSLDLMGWDVGDEGLQVIFSKQIPSVVQQKIKWIITSFLHEQGLELEGIQHFITHPGGTKVLQAYKDALQIDKKALAGSYEILRKYGNMSSVTVLFVLAEELKHQHAIGSYGLMSALGPGFSAELSLIRWI